MYVLALFVLLVLLLIGSAFCSSAETAFFSLNPLQVRRIGQKRPSAGTRIHAILSNPTRLLSSILIGNTIVNVAASAVGYRLAEHFFLSRGEQIAIPTMTILIIIFGEIGPKRVGLFLPCQLATLYHPAVEALQTIATPLRVSSTGSPASSSATSARTAARSAPRSSKPSSISAARRASSTATSSR